MEDNYLIFMSDQKGVLPVLAGKINNGKFRKIYKDTCNFNGFWFKLFRKYKLPFMKIMFDKWKKEKNDKIEKIIVFDSGYNKYAIRAIKKSYKNAKIILYYWNHINEYSEKFLKDKAIDEFWTFDLEDVKKYKIKYNPQFYTKKVLLQDDKIEYDILFLGRDKNRKNYIMDLKKKISKQKINSKIIIIEKENDFVQYEEYLKMLSKSKTILDIVYGEKMGLTLRTMESIFFNKKLITNNQEVLQYDFYNPKNIFILGKDNEENLKAFIQADYENLDKEVIDYYDFETWVTRF